MTFGKIQKKNGNQLSLRGRLLSIERGQVPKVRQPAPFPFALVFPWRINQSVFTA
jgi:hypothetical protein